jgi:PAS domain S-box-containing protein
MVGTILPEVEGASEALANHIQGVREHPDRYQSYERENLRRDGGRVWICWTHKPLYNQEGVFSEVLCIGNDVTGRKHIEEALRASEESYREIFNATTSAIFIHEVPSGRILDVNQTMLDMFEFTREEALGDTLGRLWSLQPEPFTPERAYALINRAVETGFEKFEWLCIKKSGKPFWAEVVLKKVVIGGTPRVLALVEDISERKRWEEALRSSEQNYHEIFDSAINAILVHDFPSGRVLDVNQATLDMFGCSREEAFRMSFWRQVGDSTRHGPAAAIRLIRKAVVRGQQTVQWPAHRKNGQRFWVESTIRQATIGGRPRALVVLRDITDHRRAEEALVESQRKLTTALHIAKLGYWEYDKATNLFTFDDQFYALFHTTAEKEGGYTMSPSQYAARFLPPEDVHMVEDEMRLSMETKDPAFSRQVEHRIRYADGEIGHMAVRYFIVKDDRGNTIKTYGANQDITDRKKAEAALKASEQNYQEIFNASTSSIALIDVDTGRFVDVNQALLELHGVTRDEALEMTVTDISADQSPEAQLKITEFVDKAIHEGPQRLEWRFIRSNGEKFWAEVSLRVAVIGGVPRVIGLAMDITDRKRAEQRLLEEQQTLQQLLESQERERQLIAYEIHDGLAQTLAGAAMYCGSFERLAREDLDEALKSHGTGANMLQEALREARRLIRGLRPPILDEAGLVAAVEHLVSDLNTTGKAEITFDARVQFGRLEPAWENSLFRIIQESLTNAQRYSGSDRVEVRLVQEDDHVALEIQDWGEGFDPDQVERKCFGLKGIRERANLMGGSATIESAPGEGTRVRVDVVLNQNGSRLSPGNGD